MRSFRDSGPFSCPRSLLGFLTQVLSIPSASAQRNRMENPMWLYFLCLEMMSFLYTHSLPPELRDRETPNVKGG